MAISGKDASAYDEMIKGIWRDNPVFVQVLGMCPMLAVTNSAINAMTMGLATLFVLVGSSALVSLFRNLIPKQVRISLYIIIIATFVTVIDYTLLALVPAIHKELGAFIPLIVANCMILGRQEAFAGKHSVRFAVMDAIGMAGGFLFAMLVLGSIREILGSGSLFGIDLLGVNFDPWVIMILPPGGFLTLGLILLFFNWVTARRRQFLEQVVATERGNV
ncbi:electron transport complex subunit RsxE [Candidatus Endoriftia persephone]|jgi:electron transport complex protein RnfE|uniref:Ion-translocating oxidoreductase complex subunit E n=3 Tax=Gammaproteobacteria TaxID=1236 RepID=G2FGK9_9GAMM|nr:electron transport complex subunit E [Candidatus Endoriftia persephone]EGV52919.1 electron transport complex protein RnfE1 [endosymbiont of Riftia pachyptila (vent Ph05)]EGW54120.1 electron transport complex protein RnfE [endosymbiont of Tevnia jerichonana (vent Tica)]USF87625.1 electron transport complex subunit E [Candidatus Endoriftia persephone]